MKIAVLTDSTAYLDQAYLEKYQIKTIALNVIFKDKTYKELSELNTDDFYKRMRNETQLPTTSQPAMGEYVQLLESLKEEGYTDVIAVHLSSGISGTFQSAVTANAMVEDIQVHPFDSEISCAVQGFYAIKAAQFVQQGMTVVDNILEQLESMKQTTNAYFIVDDLNNLKKGGRLNSAQAFVGTMLQVKPLLHFVDTKIVPYDKVRTKKRAMKRIEEQLAKEVDGYKNLSIVIIEGNDKENALLWKTQIEEKFPGAHVILSYFGPVIGTHLGEGALGLGFTTTELDLSK
ncbi:fatty acid kinase binding subunit FakB1 [Mammaliicoccus vitulinus]|uniref:fatty acid kinase binding subunit FakB1 n=1 Tax=Mammaliicoccus vitulinus TaxID=71237 RepID=UPI0019522A1D|nr:fatty acid kinase binding subunit FakB1 [Mammaliicoccus vitulinus]MBM6629827.1 fatty acid kinase binding subunit FakB1 [Mammaliicoccus vitulinus]WQK87458.1 fatty acid kinase binding subunit FakB1 [Mammaliicoccus vitulinus]